MISHKLTHAPLWFTAPANRLILLGYFSFFCLGLMSGLLGLSWTTMHVDLGMPLDALGILLFAQMAVGFGITMNHAAITQKLGGYGNIFLIGSSGIAIGIFLMSIAPVALVAILGSVCLGIGNSLLNLGLNSYFAATSYTRSMNWLHASFGVGVTVIPLIGGWLFREGYIWRSLYGVAFLFVLVMVTMFVLTRPLWQPVDTQGNPAQTRKPIKATLRQAVLWPGILLFFFYAGIQVVPGQWMYNFFTEGRQFNPETASYLLSLYWGGLTVGRFVLGAVSARVDAVTLLRVCHVFIVIFACVLWLNPLNLADTLGLAIYGFVQAPTIPIMLTIFRKYIGPSHAHNAMGLQMTGSSIGMVVLPGLAGVLIEQSTPFVILPMMVILSVGTLICFEVMQKVAQRQQTATP